MHDVSLRMSAQRRSRMPDQITTEEFADHMDAFEQRLGARASRSDRRVEAIDSRLDAIDGRLDAIDTRLDVIDGRLRGLVDAIEERLVERDKGGRRLEDVDGESMSIAARGDDDFGVLIVTAQPPAGVEPVSASEMTVDKANGIAVETPKPSRGVRGRGTKIARETPRVPRASDGPAKRVRQRRSRT